ncbi:hypothetical protein IW261DRAFT_1464320 [Armillaria novae-zelandiae]|uniref:C3H1-type domain-containing protein n=1 Tax=Armillaria novae-zelandiae TaxID=153914 RepID=A0AA39TEB7_9AGAR|nr:hypothetical protein IW261DRAFT_1464320 [Armillaria novae-zelandiae]
MRLLFFGKLLGAYFLHDSSALEEPFFLPTPPFTTVMFTDKIRCSYFTYDGASLGPCPYGASCRYVHPGHEDWEMARSFYGRGSQPSPSKRPRMPTTLREAELLANFHYIDLDRAAPWPTDCQALPYRPPVPSSEDAYLQHVLNLLVQGIKQQLAIRECATRRREIQLVSNAFPNGNQTKGVLELARYKDLDSLEKKLGHLMAETLGDLVELPEPATPKNLEANVEALYEWVKDNRDHVEDAIKYLKANGDKIWIPKREVRDITPQLMNQFKTFLQTRIARIESQIIRGTAEMVKRDVAKVEMLSSREDEEYNTIVAAMKGLRMAHPLLNPRVGETVIRSRLQPKLDEFKKISLICFEKKLDAAVSNCKRSCDILQQI